MGETTSTSIIKVSVVFLISPQGPTWWRDQAGWWCQLSASTLKPASSSPFWAPAITTKRRRSRKVRHETKPRPPSHTSQKHKRKKHTTQCWSVKDHTKTVSVLKCCEEGSARRQLSPCQLLNTSTLMFEQCRLEVFARFCFFLSAGVDMKFLLSHLWTLSAGRVQQVWADSSRAVWRV